MLARRVLGDTYSCGLVAQPGGSMGRAVTTPGSWPIVILARPFRPRQPANPEPDRGTSSHHRAIPLFHTSYDDIDHAALYVLITRHVVDLLREVNTLMGADEAEAPE